MRLERIDQIPYYDKCDACGEHLDECSCLYLGGVKFTSKYLDDLHDKTMKDFERRMRAVQFDPEFRK